MAARGRAVKVTSRSVLASVAAGLCLGLGTTALWLAVTTPNPYGAVANAQLTKAFAACWTFGFGLIGLLILTRRSGNRIGWVALVLGFSLAFNSITSDLSTLSGGPASEVGLNLELAGNVGWLVWLSLFSWFLLLFPSGHLPSRRWLPFAWALAVWPPLYLVAAMLAPLSISAGAATPNRYVTIGGALGDFLNLALTVLNFLVAPLLVGSLIAAIVRFRHSRGPERQQLKWLAYWAALLVAAIVLNVAAPNPVTIALSNLVILGLPITVAIAIFRYRLYDIDLLIKRSAVYGATTAAIAATFFLGIVALQAALRPLTSGSELAVAASTLISFALFQPIRRRIQGAVDHRFDRSRYDATLTVDAFAVQLRDEVDLDALRAQLLGAVSRTMSPAHASLWLRERTP
jgi:hypothetical protein